MTTPAEHRQWSTSFHTWLFLAVLLLAVAACVAGIVYAVNWGDATDGQRGGAVGVALSFLALFVAQPVPAAVLEDQQMASEALDAQPTRVTLLRTALAAMLDIQRSETRFLAAASVFSTLVWGFGDVVAAWCGAPV